MDLLGMNAISKGLRAAGYERPGREQLFTWALAGDIISNAFYYSLAGIGQEKNVWLKSAALGFAAGAGAVLLPGPLGLNEKHSNRTVTTRLMTIGLYVDGALVTTAVMKLLEKRKVRKETRWEHRLVTSAMV